MAMWSLIAVFFFHFSFFTGSVSVNFDKHNTTFTPSKQWKKVEGQALPTELHARVNLHTGEEEAKLPTDENDKKSLLVSTENNENVKNENAIDPDKLKRLLKNIKSDDGSSGSAKGGSFRTYEKLKEDFNKLHLNVKNDIEILTSLIQNFKKLNLVKSKDRSNKSSDWSEDEDTLTILVDLEYLVHQYDNAQEFAKLNGFSDVIYASLNSTSSEIRSEALRLLGSATQSNPKVQIAALDSGAIHLLLKILAFDEDINVRSRSLFALSCVIRRFPAAQHKLITDGGFTAFAKVFDEEKHDFMKLQVKIITLIHDLLFERKDTKMNILEGETRNQTDSEVDMLKEQLQQYEKMDLEKKLVEQEWCKRISDWFTRQDHVRDLNKNTNSRLTLENVNLESHDIIEKVVETLYVLSDICKFQFQSDIDFINLLFTLRDVYSDLAVAESKKNESEDDSTQFYSGLSNVLKMLTDKLKGVSNKDEL